MSLGYTIIKDFAENIRVRWRVVDLKMDTDYPSGGYTLSASSLKLNGILAVIPCGQEDGYTPVWDRSAGKLKIMMDDLSSSTDGPAVDCDAGRNDLENKIVTVIVMGY